MTVYRHIEQSKREGENYCYWWYEEQLRKELIGKGYKVGKPEYGLESVGLGHSKIMKIKF